LVFPVYFPFPTLPFLFILFYWWNNGETKKDNKKGRERKTTISEQQKDKQKDNLCLYFGCEIVVMKVTKQRQLQNWNRKIIKYNLFYCPFFYLDFVVVFLFPSPSLFLSQRTSHKKDSVPVLLPLAFLWWNVLWEKAGNRPGPPPFSPRAFCCKEMAQRGREGRKGRGQGLIT